MAKMMESFNPSSSGYQFMWIILAVGIVGLGFAIERFIYRYPQRQGPRTVPRRLRPPHQREAVRPGSERR